MKRYWENDGNADANGNFAAVVDKEDGSRPSRFVGKDQKEVADRMMESYGELVVELDRQRTANRANLKPDAPPPNVGPSKPPRALTPDEAFAAADAIRDPSKIQQTIAEIIEATTGVPPSELGKIVAESKMKDADAYFGTEARAFVAATPDYRERFFCPENSSSLLNYCEANKLMPTRNNLAIAFDDLNRKGLLIEVQPPDPNAAPDPESSTGGTNPPDPAPNPPRTVRPRTITNIATGMRSGDASATPPTPQQRPKLTRAMIDAMPRHEYETKLRTDPAFRKAVDLALA
jgi:hypothetical protein